MSNEVVNIRDYIIKETDAENTVSATAAAKKPKTRAKYSVVFNSGTDFIIQKETSRTKNSLVIIVSQKQYYLKNELTEEITMLDLENRNASAEALTKFFADNVEESDDFIDCKDLEWVSELPHSKKECEDFLRFLGAAQKVLKYKLIMYKPYMQYEYYMQSRLDNVLRYTQVFIAIRDAYPEVSHETFSNCIFSRSAGTDNLSVKAILTLLDSIHFLDLIEEKYSIKNLRDFLATYKSLPVAVRLPQSHHMSTIKQMFKDYIFEYKSLRDYALYEAVTQGYATTYAGIFSQWADTLEMQEMVYKKIVNKYPKYLSSEHYKLSYLVARNKEEYDKEKWKRRYKANLRLEWENNRYIVHVPETKMELNDEATQQSNCVAGYFDRIIDGQCSVVFLRLKEKPEESWVTVEIRNDTVVQAKLRYNYSIDVKARKALEVYCSERELKLAI